MTHRICLLTISRDRPELVRQLAESLAATKHPHSEHHVFVPESQEDDYFSDYLDFYGGTHPFEGITGVAQPLNYAANRLKHQFDTIAFVDDDLLFRSQDWEARVLEARDKNLIVHCEDGLTHGALPGHVFLDTRIIKALNYMQPPRLLHLFGDNVWLDWGNRLNSIAYLPDVLIEHMHPFNNKRPMDNLTGTINSESWRAQDQSAYGSYLRFQLADDVAKIRKAIE